MYEYSVIYGFLSLILKNRGKYYATNYRGKGAPFQRDKYQGLKPLEHEIKTWKTS